MTRTIFVTGASGFIAKHIVLGLLNGGYRVVGSVRSLDKAAAVRAALLPHLDDTADLDARLRFVALDLTRDDGWAAALQGVDVLMHTASPFPMTQPDDPEVLIRPAVEGALRALRAAADAGVNRVILTSSSAAVQSGNAPRNGTVYTEADFSNPDAPGVSPYARSKTLAEAAAWDFVRTTAPQIALTTINPVFVLGPALAGGYGTSVAVVERLLRARDPMLPNFGFTCVDVRDVALAHIRAMERPEAAGERFIVADQFLWFTEMAETLKAAFPDRRIVTRRAPDWVVKCLALFDKAIRSIVPDLGQRSEVDGSKAARVLGITYTDARVALVATGQSLIDQKAV